MPMVVSRSLTIERSNVKQYMTADNITLDTSYLGKDCALRSSHKTGYAIFNDDAKAILFPNTTAHPLKADSTMEISASSNKILNYVDLQFDGTSVHHQYCSVTSETKTDLTNTVITSSTSDTQIRYKMNIDNLFVSAIATQLILTLYFNQYSMSANAVGNGISAANVDKAEAYDGDIVTFTAALAAGATFDGWYSDAACTQLVSTNPTYTTSAADLTLYAKAEAKAGTGVYLKANGAFTEAKAVYKKSNGSWSFVDKSVFEAEKKYQVIT